MLVTHPLDTRTAAFLQFMFRFSGNKPINRNVVIVQFTWNNGVTWKDLLRLRGEDGDHIRLRQAIAF